MLADNSLCEAPLCAHDFINIINIESSLGLNLTDTLIAGKIFTINNTHTLSISDSGVLAKGYDIIHNINVSNNLDVTRLMNLATSDILTLASVVSPNLIYTIAVTDPIFISDDLIVNNIYNIELCSGVYVAQHLGWVIDLEASNTISCTVEEVQSAFTEFTLAQSIETNMDDVNCLQPGGKANDFGPSTTVNIAQSVNGRMIYACSATSNMSLLSSVAWR